MSDRAAMSVDDARGWLEAAAGGGLPDPVRTRWQPLRVGIVDLWEYDQQEFWAADGRLVLRGGNGAGKTKVLELTTLMLLRGEIGASVLDPFGSQHRTMRFNLLPTGDADDPRPPADSGLGYAWAEFGRIDDTGRARFLVLGMGMSVRRGTGTTPVVPWRFVTELRPGKGLALRAGGRAIDLKELRKVDGVWIAPSAAAYRARVAEDLFAMQLAAFDNLTDLLKQLRRPKLGERLNPTALADTLRDALPPIAEHELTQLADGWDRLDRLRVAVEATEEAARSVAGFVRTGWRPWARLVLRRAADGMAAATTTLDNTTREAREADQALQKADGIVQAADGALARARSLLKDQRAELRQLLDQPDFQDAVGAAARVQSLGEQLDVAVGRRKRAAADSTEKQKRLASAQKAWAEADENCGKAVALVADAAGTVLSAGRTAGLGDAVERYVPDRDRESLAAALAVRRERFGHLSHLHEKHEKANGAVQKAAEEVMRNAGDLRSAKDEERTGHAEVLQRASSLDTAICEWAAMARLVPARPEVVEGWRTLVPGLTVIDETTGEIAAGPSVVDALRGYLSGRSADVERAVGAARIERQPHVTRRTAVAEELAAVRAAVDEPPPAPTTWRRRDRPGLDEAAGAPLWRLVNPAPGVDGTRLARLEATLAASGLLDVWLSPDGRAHDADGRLLQDVTVAGRAHRPGGLQQVLVPDAGGGVPAAAVGAVLDAVDWHEQPPSDQPGPWLAADGSWRIGDLTGRAEPTGSASYLGAAARAEARQRRIDDLESKLAELDELISALDDRLEQLAAERSELDRQSGAVPVAVERRLTEATARLGERAKRVSDARSALAIAERAHRERLTERDTAWAEFTDYAGRHSFAVADLPGQDRALDAFAGALSKLGSALDVLDLRTETVAAAAAARETCEQDLRAAGEEMGSAEEDERTVGIRLRTAESTMTADARQLLDRRRELDDLVERSDTTVQELTGALTTANADAVAARVVLAGREQRRLSAETARNAAADLLWSVLDARLGAAVDVPAPERRTVTAARDLAVAVRRETSLATDDEVDRAWRRCYARMEELRQTLLPDRDAHVVDDVAGPPRVEVLADPASGWEPPFAAAETLARHAERQRAGYDAEQQQVLTTLLGSTFIEHLKERLDHTEHTLARINEKLAAHPTRYGHAVRVLRDAEPGDVDAAAVVAALSGRGYHELSAEKQDMVRGFLARRIDEARSDSSGDATTDWKDQLVEALDYRRWLRLTLQYRAGPGAPWAVFDVARHGAKSGGEKVVLLSQPLFAAVVVAYDAAGPNAPRWVWLDEAMTGVDAPVKASFMGLTVDFELDVMLTAHDEWCTYPTVPAVAICDLARLAHVPGVDVVPHLWCGGDLTRLDVERLGGSRDVEEPTDGLFGIDGG